MKKSLEECFSSKEKDYVAFVAHELKNPLSAINGFAQILNYPDLPKEKSEEIAKHIQTITVHTQTQILGLQKLIEDNYQMEKVDLFSCLESSINLFHKFKKIEIEIKPFENVEIFVEKSLLEIVFLNLFDNAIKHAKVDKIFIEIQTLAEDVCIKIIDLGKRISTQYFSRVFEKYFQEKKSPQGIGLGLFLVKQILQKHMAKIEIIPTDGTCFQITMPKAVSEEIRKTSLA